MNNKCLNYFSSIYRRTKLFKITNQWNEIIIMHMYKERTLRQPHRGNLKSVHREISLPQFRHPIVYIYTGKKKITLKCFFLSIKYWRVVLTNAFKKSSV